MTKHPLTALTLAAFLATSILPAMPVAAADFSGMPDMRYNPYGANAKSGGTTAGAYFRMPFKGGLRRPRTEARIGFALSTRLTGQSHNPSHFAAAGTPRLIDLSLGLSGQQPLGQSLQFNGMSFHQINGLYAGEDGGEGEDGEGGKKKKGSALKTGLIAVGVLGLGLVAVVGLACATNESPPPGEWDFSPC